MDNLFDTNQNDQIQIDPNKNYFPELVGDGKKFKDQEALAKKTLYADAHIAKLEAENAAKDANYVKLKAEYDAAASLREMLKEMQSRRAEDLDNRNDPPAIQNDVQSPAQKPEDIQKLVFEAIRQNDSEKIYQNNLRDVQAKLKERYGDNYANILKEQTENLGLTSDMVNNLARTSPKAFFKTMGLEDQQGDLFQAPPRTNQTFRPNTGPKRTWAWYQEMKRSDPKTYNLPNTQVQMHQDRAELGDAFKDGDWGIHRI